MTDKYDKYESMDEIDKLKFLADVANMYYNLNMTQIDISKELVLLDSKLQSYFKMQKIWAL